VDIAAALGELKKRNGERIRAACTVHKAELMTGVGGEVARLSGVFDEDELETGLAAATRNVLEQFAARAGGLRSAEQCVEVEGELKREVRALQERARAVLAEKIKRVLKEPLTEICKRIIEARCPGYGALESVLERG
jgi:hypothetical protein